MSQPELGPRERLAILQGAGATTMDLVSVVKDGEAIIGESEVPDLGRLDFEALNVRRGSTGLHARVRISRADAELAYSVFNVDRDEDRTRLANSAAKRLGDSKRWGEAIKLRLDQFCGSIWPCHVTASEGDWQAGNRGARPEFLLEPYLLAGGGTILFGPPGSTKSYIAMIWALGITHAGAMPWRSAQAPVLLVNLERDAASVAWRTDCIAEILGTPSRLLVINRRGSTLSHVHEAVLATVKRYGAGLVIVDSLSRAGTGSLTDDEDSNRAMDMLNGLGVAWCILAHTPRADTTHEYGSVMQSAAADRTVRCISSTDRENSRAGVQLEVVKANDRGRPKPEVFTLQFDERDDLVEFRKASQSEWPDLTSATASSEDQIVSYLRESGSAPTSEIASETGLAGNLVRAICGRSSKVVKLQEGGGRGNPTVWGAAAACAVSEEA